MRVVSNFYLESFPGYCELDPKAGSGTTWAWVANDWSDDEQKAERLALKFDP